MVPPRTASPIIQPRPSERPVEAIQRAVGMTGADIDGILGRVTTARIRGWQTAKGLDADGVWGPASDGLAFPPAGSKHWCDFSFARFPGAQLAAAGFKGVMRYLWQLTYSGGQSKGLSRAEYADLTGAGMEVGYSYEEDPTLPIKGYAVGVEQAKAAERHREREGLPVQPIYFNIDRDADPSEYPAILDGLCGAAAVVGWDRTRLYAGYRVVKAAFDAGVISGAWQTYAWSQDSNGRTLWDPRAELQQWANGQWGDSIDFTRSVVPLRVPA